MKPQLRFNLDFAEIAQHGLRQYQLLTIDPGIDAIPPYKGGSDDEDKSPEPPQQKETDDSAEADKETRERKKDERRNRPQLRRQNARRARPRATGATVRAKKKRARKRNGGKPDPAPEAEDKGDEGTKKSGFRVPMGVSSMSYRLYFDPNTGIGKNYLMWNFQSGAKPILDLVNSVGGDVEDSVHQMSLPAMATVPPQIITNTVYVKVIGLYVVCTFARATPFSVPYFVTVATAHCDGFRRYVIYPRCLLPIGEECKNDAESAKHAKTSQGGRKKRSRKLLAVGDSVDQVGVGDEDEQVMPMSALSSAMLADTYDTMGRLPPWGDVEPSRGLIAHQQREMFGMNDGADATVAVRRLETRGAAYADQSLCVSASFELLPPKPITIFTYKVVFFIGPVPLGIQMEAAIVLRASMTIMVCLQDKTVVASLEPGVALEGSVFGGLSLLIAKAGIELIVALMDISLVPSASLSIKRGLEVCLALDLILVPVTITLQAVLSFFLCLKFCTVREAALLGRQTNGAHSRRVNVLPGVFHGLWRPNMPSTSVWSHVRADSSLQSLCDCLTSMRCGCRYCACCSITIWEFEAEPIEINMCVA